MEIIVKIKKEELEQAKKFAEAYDKGNYGENVLGVPHEEYIEFIRVGKLCELVFVRHLREQGIECDDTGILTPCKDSHKIGADFKLIHSGQEVDVKAANKPFHIRMLVREDQFKAHIHDLYVGAKCINDDEVEFWGFDVKGEKLSESKPQDFGFGKCRHVFLTELKLIQDFIKLCKQKKSVV